MSTRTNWTVLDGTWNYCIYIYTTGVDIYQQRKLTLKNKKKCVLYCSRTGPSYRRPIIVQGVAILPVIPIKKGWRVEDISRQTMTVQHSWTSDATWSRPWLEPGVQCGITNDFTKHTNVGLTNDWLFNNTRKLEFQTWIVQCHTGISPPHRTICNISTQLDKGTSVSIVGWSNV